MRGYFIKPHIMKAIDRRNFYKEMGISPLEEEFQIRLRNDPDFAKAVQVVREEFQRQERGRNE